MGVQSSLSRLHVLAVILCVVPFSAMTTGRPGFVHSSRNSRSRESDDVRENIRVMTAASHMTKEGCQYLLASAVKHDIDLHILGYKDKSINRMIAMSSKTSIKLVAAHDFARSLPEDDIIMLVDAFDVVFQGGVSSMLQEYERLGTPEILFSAEANCWPPMLETEGYCLLAEQLGSDPTASRFLNSGGVIGRAGPLSSLWKVLIQQEAAYFRKFSSRGQYWDDQGTVALSYLIGNPYNISLDVHSRVFMSANDALPEFDSSGRFLYKASPEGTKEVSKGSSALRRVPPVMHFNGYAKAELWKHNNWFREHYNKGPLQDVSFRVNAKGRRMSWDELCGLSAQEAADSQTDEQ